MAVLFQWKVLKNVILPLKKKVLAKQKKLAFENCGTLHVDRPDCIVYLWNNSDKTFAFLKGQKWDSHTIYHISHSMHTNISTHPSLPSPKTLTYCSLKKARLKQRWHIPFFFNTTLKSSLFHTLQNRKPKTEPCIMISNYILE